MTRMGSAMTTTKMTTTCPEGQNEEAPRSHRRQTSGC